MVTLQLLLVKPGLEREGFQCAFKFFQLLISEILFSPHVHGDVLVAGSQGCFILLIVFFFMEFTNHEFASFHQIETTFHWVNWHFLDLPNRTLELRLLNVVETFLLIRHDLHLIWG